MRYQFFSSGSCPLLDISCIGYAYNPEVTRYGPYKRNCYIIHYVLSGKGYFKGEVVSKGEGFLITPEMCKEYYPDPDEPWSLLWIISEDEKMNELFEIFNADKKTGIFSFDYVLQVQRLANELVNASVRLYNSFELLGKFLTIFACHFKSAETAPKLKNEDIYVEAAEKYINTNIQMPVTVDELTTFLGVSQPYLFKIFKKHFLVSPKEYIIEKKMSYAQELLKNSDLSITDIAKSVGYNDVLGFSKLFKKKVGISPQKYKADFR